MTTEQTRPPRYFAGIEGGASFSKLVIVDESGCEVGEWESTGLNYHLVGVLQTARLIAQWVSDALRDAKITTTLAALGMGFSGAKDGSLQNEQLVDVLGRDYPEVAAYFYVMSDTLGTLKATLPHGGALIISGTGSSCLLQTADGNLFRCGGNGHMLGDKGSGYWIVVKAIKRVLHESCGWREPSPRTALLRRLVHEYFSIENDHEILDHFYKSFDKPKIAGFCKVLAANSQDQVCAELFETAGRVLGLHIKKAFATAAASTGKPMEALDVVAVGSVFKSWSLLEKGFISGVRDGAAVLPKRLRIFAVEETVAKGIALAAATSVGLSFPYDFDATKKLLYQCTFEESPSPSASASMECSDRG